MFGSSLHDYGVGPPPMVPSTHPPRRARTRTRRPSWAVRGPSVSQEIPLCVVELPGVSRQISQAVGFVGSRSFRAASRSVAQKHGQGSGEDSNGNSSWPSWPVAVDLWDICVILCEVEEPRTSCCTQATRSNRTLWLGTEAVPISRDVQRQTCKVHRICCSMPTLRY